MAAGISFMYRHSGGCEKDNICAKCGYLETEQLRTKKQFRCALHRNITGENQIWKGSYVSCKRFQPKAGRKRLKLKEQESGQMCMVF